MLVRKCVCVCVCDCVCVCALVRKAASNQDTVKFAHTDTHTHTFKFRTIGVINSIIKFRYVGKTAHARKEGSFQSLRKRTTTCPHTPICVCSLRRRTTISQTYYNMCPHTPMCPHTTIWHVRKVCVCVCVCARAQRRVS